MEKVSNLHCVWLISSQFSATFGWKPLWLPKISPEKQIQEKGHCWVAEWVELSDQHAAQQWKMKRLLIWTGLEWIQFNITVKGVDLFLKKAAFCVAMNRYWGGILALLENGLNVDVDILQWTMNWWPVQGLTPHLTHRLLEIRTCRDADGMNGRWMDVYIYERDLLCRHGNNLYGGINYSLICFHPNWASIGCFGLCFCWTLLLVMTSKQDVWWPMENVFFPAILPISPDL